MLLTRQQNDIRLLLMQLCLAVLLTPSASAESLRPIPLWSAATLKQVCEQGIADAREGADAIRKAFSPTNTGFIGKTRPAEATMPTLLAFEKMAAKTQDVASIAGLMMSTSPDPSVRTEASECSRRWSEYWSELYQDRQLYEALNLEGGDAIDRKLLRDLKRRFKSSGVQLDSETQQRVRAIRKEMTALSLEFDRNLRDNTSRLAFTEEEARGVPKQVLDKAQRDEQGRYLLGFSYPEYYPFMDNAHDDAAKKRYYLAFSNRGGDRNLEILSRLVILRHQLAQLMGHQSYAAMVTAERMVGHPQRVLSFLEEVQRAAEPREKRELEEIRAFMRARSADHELKRWNLSYWQQQLRKERFQIDQEKIRTYFPTQTAIEFSLDIATRLYDVDFKAVTLPTWHESVTVWEVRRKGGTPNEEALALIYLDLFPRAGKYTHAAAFPTRGVSRALNRKPVSVMVANFNEKGLSHSELKTLLHEFGHILHGVLSDTRYLAHAGTSVERDFVEAPSQMFEAWGRSYQSLKLLSERCQPDCPAITPDLIDRLEASRRFGEGIQFNTQRLYSAFDMQLHEVRPGTTPDPLSIWSRLQSQTALGYVDGTKFPSSFGHLAGGYAVGYYGYLWAQVIALDMQSAFKNDLMDVKVARRYRDLILTRGSERKAQDMVREFLGRDPSTEAFFNTLNGF